MVCFNAFIGRWKIHRALSPRGPNAGGDPRNEFADHFGRQPQLPEAPANSARPPRPPAVFPAMDSPFSNGPPPPEPTAGAAESRASMFGTADRSAPKSSSGIFCRACRKMAPRAALGLGFGCARLAGQESGKVRPFRARRGFLGGVDVGFPPLPSARKFPLPRTPSRPLLKPIPPASSPRKSTAWGRSTATTPSRFPNPSEPP